MIVLKYLGVIENKIKIPWNYFSIKELFLFFLTFFTKIFSMSIVTYSDFVICLAALEWCCSTQKFTFFGIFYQFMKSHVNSIILKPISWDGKMGEMPVIWGGHYNDIQQISWSPRG